MTQTSKRACLDLGELIKPAFFRALCDPTRIAILAFIAKQRTPKAVSEVAASGCCDVDLSVVSRHLGLLRDAGLLESSRRGKEVLYALRAAPIVAALRGLADALEASASPASSARKDPK